MSIIKRFFNLLGAAALSFICCSLFGIIAYSEYVSGHMQCAIGMGIMAVTGWMTLTFTNYLLFEVNEDF